MINPETVALFVTTWAQIAILYYKLGRVEQHVKDLNHKSKILS